MSQDLRIELLLVLRLRAIAGADVLAERVGASEQAVGDELAELDSWGFVRFREGLAPGWSLTPLGRREGEAMLRTELADNGLTAEVEALYERFLPLNATLLSVVTDWQTVVIDGEHVPNDHSDAARDEAILTRLDELQRAADPLTESLGSLSSRFSGYRPRLDTAHRNVIAGHTEWLARPTLDSYHGIWFELHEHLLATLGRERATEPIPQYSATATIERPASVGCETPQNGDFT